MVKGYFAACEQAFPAQRAQLRRLALALGRGGVERMEQLCAMQRAGPERLLELRSIGAKSLPLIAAVALLWAGPLAFSVGRMLLTDGGRAAEWLRETFQSPQQDAEAVAGQENTL